MMALWLRLASRVNSMTLRERFLLFACVIAVLGGVTHLLFISPLIEQQRVLVEKIDKKSSEMDMLRDETNMEMRKRSRDYTTDLSARALKVQADIDLVEQEIAALTAKGGASREVSAILNRVLRRSDKIALIRVVPVGTELSAMPQGGARPTGRGGVDITLSGNYLDLMVYMAQLEKDLPQARWGALVLKAEPMPVQLTIRLLTTAAQS